MTEIAKEWRPVKGYEGLYEVSNHGEVKSLARYAKNHNKWQFRPERLLKPHGKTHLMVVLCKEGKTKPALVHRIVAEAFIDNPFDKPVVDHIDTNSKNNRVDNLRWVTTQENALNPLTRIHNSDSKKGHPCYLKCHTEESKEKMRRAKLGRKASEETRRKLSESHKGIKPSQESIERGRLAKMGHHVSDETRQKIREKLTGVHKGKHWKVENGKRVWYEGE